MIGTASEAPGNAPTVLRMPGDCYAVGEPQFVDTDIAVIGAARGDGAAWAELFERHGASAPQRVRGTFAVAVRVGDGRSFMAVDRFSVCTLCYRIANGDVIVDSRADIVAGARAEVDPQSLFDYLFLHVISAPRTVFRGVARLPAGHCAIVQGTGTSVSRWWNPDFVENARGNVDRLADEFVDKVRGAIRRASAKGVVGCFLSGGTDSSTVAGMLGEETGRPAQTFSIGFDAEGYDEMHYARIAARHFGTRHVEYYITPEDLVASIPAIAASYDQPYGNSSVLPTYCCARLAAGAGVTRLLGGDGGDELFGGNSRYARQRLFGAYEALPPAIRRTVVEPALRGRPATSIPVLRKAASYVEQARVPMPDRTQMYNLLARIGFAEVLDDDFRQAVDPTAPLAHLRHVYADTSARSLVNRMLAFDWRVTLADNDLPKVVGATSVAGVEASFPLLDDDVVDFSLKLHPALKLRGLRLRWFFKYALRDFLPEAILEKKKHGFGLPFGPWVTRHERLQALARESLESLARRHIVRGDFVDRLMRDLLFRHPGYYGELVWVLMMLEQWLASRGVAPAERVAPDPRPAGNTAHPSHPVARHTSP